MEIDLRLVEMIGRYICYVEISIKVLDTGDADSLDVGIKTANMS